MCYICHSYNKDTGGDKYVTPLRGTKGVRGPSFYMYITPKDFLTVFPGMQRILTEHRTEPQVGKGSRLTEDGSVGCLTEPLS